MRAVLIVNTGSPKTKCKADVKWFIGAMLSDPQVMTVPDWGREFLAKRIIAPLRASRSAAKYSLIWNKANESPLIRNTRLLAEKIESKSDMPVEYAMRYGQPYISEALHRLIAKCPQLHEVVVVPMFPHYAQSSYQTTVDEVQKVYDEQQFSFSLKFIPPFFDDQEYIHALAKSIRPFLENKYDRLIFCYHSLPLSHIEAAREKGKECDYIFQLKETVRLVSKELEIDPRKNRLVYSSAMGKNWLQPSLNNTMQTLPKEGFKRIILVAPGFCADNLETLYDINLKAKDIFQKNGGKYFQYVPALNAEDYWVENLIKMVTRFV